MQALYRLSYSPMVRCGARYSQSPGVAGLSSAASPRSAGMAGLPIMVLTLWMCQQASTFTLGWCAQGPQELNLHFARVGAESPIRWLIPR